MTAAKKAAEVEEAEVMEEKKPAKKAASKGVSKEEIIAAIEQMSVLDLSELVKELEEKFGVSASAPAMAMPMARPRLRANHLGSTMLWAIKPTAQTPIGVTTPYQR